MQSVAVAALVLAFAAAAAAQERGRQGSNHPHQGPRPSRPDSAPPPAPISPFAATPETYAPHYDRAVGLRHGRGLGLGVPVYGNPIGFGSYAPATLAPAPPAPDKVTQPAEPPKAPEPPKVPEPPKAVAPVPERPPIAVAHGPDTFYVIPGCYAGNRPPIPERLPKGCDITRVRTVPIR